MKFYKVAVTETKRKVVAVPAESEKQAHQRVQDAWQNGEVILEDETFQGAEFYVVGEGDDPFLPHVDGKEKS